MGDNRQEFFASSELSAVGRDAANLESIYHVDLDDTAVTPTKSNLLKENSRMDEREEYEADIEDYEDHTNDPNEPLPKDIKFYGAKDFSEKIKEELGKCEIHRRVFLGPVANYSLMKNYHDSLYLIFTDFNLTHVEQKMFPAKVLADLSSVHGRPTKRPNAYEQHKANLKKLLRQRQKQIQERRNKPRSNIKSTTSPDEVRISLQYVFRASRIKNPIKKLLTNNIC